MKLTNSQLNDIIIQYVDRIVNNMDIHDLQDYVTESMCYDLCKLDENELEETIARNYDYNLFKELADNVITESIQQQRQLEEENYQQSPYNLIPSRY